MFFAPAPTPPTDMINILTRIFGSRNERLLKQYGAVVRQINALEPQMAALADDALKAKTAQFRERLAQGETLDALLPEAFAVVREASKRTLQMRHFDVQLIGGMALRQRQDRGNAHGRRQDARLDAARLSQRAGRQGRAHRHGQRLPRAARRGLDGPDLPLPGPHRRREPVADGARREAGGVRGGHHLRHQQRVRLRLPAGQHGVRGIAARAAPAQLRDRRRSGLDPDRRGPHAAHHFGPVRGQRPALLRVERDRPEVDAPGRGEG